MLTRARASVKNERGYTLHALRTGGGGGTGKDAVQLDSVKSVTK